jgi:hypothetical protein
MKYRRKSLFSRWLGKVAMLIPDIRSWVTSWFLVVGGSLDFSSCTAFCFGFLEIRMNRDIPDHSNFITRTAKL